MSLIHHFVVVGDLEPQRVVGWGCPTKVAAALQSAARGSGDELAAVDLLAIAFHLLRQCAEIVNLALEGQHPNQAAQKQAVDLAEWYVLALKPLAGCIDSLVTLSGDNSEQVRRVVIMT